MSSNKLDIFPFLANLSKKRIEAYDSLEDDVKKQVHPFVIQRWMTGTSDAQQIFLLNELVNKNVFALSNHKRLLVQLLTVASSGTNKRYRWVKPTSKKSSSKPKTTQLICDYFGYSSKDALSAIDILSVDKIVEIAEDAGYQKQEISEIKKELK